MTSRVKITRIPAGSDWSISSPSLLTMIIMGNSRRLNEWWGKEKRETLEEAPPLFWELRICGS
jgi:hypothetical protein